MKTDNFECTYHVLLYDVLTRTAGHSAVYVRSDHLDALTWLLIEAGSTAAREVMHTAFHTNTKNLYFLLCKSVTIVIVVYKVHLRLHTVYLHLPVLFLCASV